MEYVCTCTIHLYTNICIHHCKFIPYIIGLFCKRDIRQNLRWCIHMFVYKCCMYTYGICMYMLLTCIYFGVHLYFIIYVLMFYFIDRCILAQQRSNNRACQKSSIHGQLSWIVGGTYALGSAPWSLYISAPWSLYIYIHIHIYMKI